jgi:WD40 repeat protein
MLTRESYAHIDGSSILSNSRDSSLKMLDIRANLKQLQSYTYVAPRTSSGTAQKKWYDGRCSAGSPTSAIDRCLCVLRSEKYRNNCDWNKACFSGGGKYVIAGSATGAVNVWETASGKLVSGTLVRSSVCRACVPDVLRLLMTCWLAAEMDEKHPYMIACSTWCPSTSQLITAFRGENTDVALWS